MKWCVFLFIATFVGLSFLISGCGQRSTKSVYYFGFVNKTGHDLSGVCAFYDSKIVAEPDRLVNDGSATEGPETLAIPLEAEVHWDENGVHHVVKAKLEDFVPKGFTDGTIYFIIRPNGSVDVKAIQSHGFRL
jgi:hypothetical protein